jgi:hypothetical protein
MALDAWVPLHENQIAYTHHFQEDGSKCSIFSFDVSANKHRLPLAKNAVRKLRTLRHPGIIKVLDTVEVGQSDGSLLVVKLR